MPNAPSPVTTVSPSAAATAAAPPSAGPSGHRGTIRIGLVGCGAFARFSAEQYRQLPGVRIAAVADLDPEASRRAATVLDAAVVDPEAMLVSPEIDLLYIATPPATHHRQARLALRAGRHVLVEKPLATTLAAAQELEALAACQGRICVANLVERYNPLAEAVRRLVESRVLGGLIHGVFLNEAADEGLRPEHWFWNRDVSGGIFVEHGVHFFDLVSYWLGRGRVVAAARSLRPIQPPVGGLHEPAEPPALESRRCAVEEQVSCTCRYPGDASDGEATGAGRASAPHTGVLFHFEHGFHQPNRMDRQELRLVFELGEVRLFDWVPTHGVVKAFVNDRTSEILADILPGLTTAATQPCDGDERHVRGRFRSFDATELVEATFTTGMDKMHLYAAVVRDLMADQLARIRDPAHLRRLTEADSVAAVAIACEADRMAFAAA